MTTIKQVFLSAAVAGVVAGAGSALGTAVAQAEPTDTGRSASSSESTGRADTQSPRRSRGSATDSDATSQTDSAPSADDTQTPTSGNTVRAQGSPRSESAVDRDTVDDNYSMKVYFTKALADGTNTDSLKERFTFSIASTENGSNRDAVVQSRSNFIINYNTISY
jgi:hypothetical protein